uniref:Uncharacterized protein n=1 Tax=Cairina moschata TaxID=8855 RepID=A0A8C3CWZ3_CAIMO
IWIFVKSSDTIKTVKSKIKVTPPNPQHLISAAEYGRMGILLQLHQEHAVLLVPCLCGGMNEPSLHQLTPKCSHDNMLCITSFFSALKPMCPHTHFCEVFP